MTDKYRYVRTYEVYSGDWEDFTFEFITKYEYDISSSSRFHYYYDMCNLPEHDEGSQMHYQVWFIKKEIKKREKLDRYIAKL